MNETPIYNSRIFKNYLSYLRINYPEIDIARILDYSGMPPYQIEDEGHWFTQDQVNRFHEIITKLTGDSNISRQVGRYAFSGEAAGAIRQYLLGFVTPNGAYSFLERLASNVNRGQTWEKKELGKQKIEVTVTPKSGVKEMANQCENRIGTLEAIAKIYTGKYATVEHPLCVHKGDGCCRYIVSWEEPASLSIKRMRNISLPIALGASIALPFIVPPWVALSGILLCALAVTGISLHAERVDKKTLAKNIENQGDAASRLIDQINASYNNALLVQEIGQATSSILDIDRLLTVIIEALEKRLDFDRGMIMLANRERTRLVYTIGYGYKPEEKAFLENIEFHLDNPRSRGVFVVTYRKQTPILVNDLSEIEKDLSPRSLEFARRMGTRSFICVPIIFKGESMGVLVVDNVNSKRLLNQSDMSLLMGIAPQIAISIMNAMAYRKIAESEKRFRSLSETSPDIIYTANREGLITYVNPAWERILGYDCQEALGKPLSSFLKEAETGLCKALFESALRAGNGISDVIGTFVHRDGSDRYLSISGAPNIDSDGRLIGLVGTLKDLTEIMLSEAKLKQSFEKLQMALNSTVQAISLIVESRDPYTSGHQERVSRLACAIAKEMGLPDELIASIQIASTLHDVGKINVPAEILSKPKALSPIERGMIEMHPEVGYNILKSIEFPSPVAKIVLQHHERLDGSGYPTGAGGQDIMLEARILAVADVVEAMASHRPYRAALGMEKTLAEIRANRGGLYDEEVVDACVKLFEEKRFVF